MEIGIALQGLKLINDLLPLRKQFQKRGTIIDTDETTLPLRQRVKLFE